MANAAPQLLFLWPILFSSGRSEQVAIARKLTSTTHRNIRLAPRKRYLHSTRRPHPCLAPSHLRQSLVNSQGFCTSYPSYQAPPPSKTPSTQRYGTANEPPAHLAQKPGTTISPQRQVKDQVGVPLPGAVAPPPLALSSSTGPDTEVKSDEEARKEGEKRGLAAGAQAAAERKARADARTSMTEPSHLVPKPDKPVASTDNATPELPPKSGIPAGTGALDTILSMSPPGDQVKPPESPAKPTSNESSSEGTAEKPPHLVAPRHVHNFDTYDLVKRLTEGGAFTEEQAISSMKLVRLILAENMDLARAGLVSKGDAEMNAYLFKAAASELRTEIRQRRSTAVEGMRAERNQLQHEVDVLSQRVTAETNTLKDELKGMFDDRKMSARQERRKMDNKVQELNYTISIAMGSALRNEIEALRFILTRRTVLALAGIVLMCLATLRLVNATHAKEKVQVKEVPSVRAPDGDVTSEGIAKRIETGEDSAGLVNLG